MKKDKVILGVTSGLLAVMLLASCGGKQTASTEDGAKLVSSAAPYEPSVAPTSPEAEPSAPSLGDASTQTASSGAVSNHKPNSVKPKPSVKPTPVVTNPTTPPSDVADPVVKDTLPCCTPTKQYTFQQEGEELDIVVNDIYNGCVEDSCPYRSNKDFLLTTITSLDALKQYKSEIGKSGEFEKYDAQFFQENTLFALAAPYSGWPYHVSVSAVVKHGGKVCFDLITRLPAEGECWPAVLDYQFILIAVKTESIADVNEFSVCEVRRRAYEDYQPEDFEKLDIENNQILCKIRNTYKDKTFTIADFPEIEAEKIEEVKLNAYFWITITLKDNSKQGVQEALKKLAKNRYIGYTEPNFIGRPAYS